MRIFKYIVIIGLLSCSIIIAQENNLSNMHRLAKTLEQSGEFEQAKKIYEEIYQAQPWNTTYIESLNNIYILLKEYDKSVGLLTKKIETEPGNINLYGLLGDTYYTQGDTTKAFQTWDNGIASSDQNFVAYRVITNHALQNRAFGKAIEFLKEGKKLKNNSDIFALDLARVYSMTMNFDKAAREYCELIKNNPSMTQTAIASMSQFLTRPQAIDETIVAVEKYIEDNEEPEILRMLIHLYLLKDDYKNALTNVEKLESETDSNGKEYFNFAQRALRADQYEVASKVFEKLIEDYPNSPLVPQSRIGYAKSYEQALNNKSGSLTEHWKPYSQTKVVFREEYRDAIKSYKKINELYPNRNIEGEANFRIAEIYFNKLDQPDTAIQYYNQVLNSNAISQFQFDSKLQLAEIYVRDGKLKEAETELLETQKSFDLPEEYQSKINLLIGKVYFWKGNFKIASEKLSKVTENLFDDNANDALQLMTLINTLNKDSTTLANYADAELLAHRQKYSKAAEKFLNLKGSQNPIISELAGLKYAQILVAEDNYTSALQVLDKTAEESSLKMFEPDIHFLKGEIKFYALKDYEGALKAYRNVLENYSNSLYFDSSREKIEYINELKKKSI